MTKNLKGLQQKCSGCGGDLIFSPKTQSLFCANCQSQVAIPNEKNFEKHETDFFEKLGVEDLNKTNKNLLCPNCGATIELGKLDCSTKCQYCGSSLIVEARDLPGVKPDAIIPFQFDKNQASQKFCEGVRKKWFVPNKFKKEIPQGDITGIYVPTFLFDAKSNSTYSGRLEETETITDSEGHTQTISRSYNISGTNRMIHSNVEIEASSQINQSELDAIKPFEYSNMCKFNQDYLRGYNVELNDKGVEECHSLAREIMKNDIRNNILAGYSYSSVEYLNVATTFKEELFTYSILPTYRFDYSYGKKKYSTFMNGQTGRVGKGVPRSKTKIAFFATSIILVILAIALSVILFL